MVLSDPFVTACGRLPETTRRLLKAQRQTFHGEAANLSGKAQMFPSLFGCRTPSELARVRGWDKNLPPQILGALPKRSWLKRLRRLGLEVLVPLWRHVQEKSPATRSRWQWTWVADDSVFKKYGEQLGLVGTWWSGQEHRVLSGIDGVLLVVVIGDGKLVVPVDFAIRRPDPTGPGAPAAINCTGSRACWMDVWQHSADTAWHCLRRWSSRIAGSAIRSSCAMWLPPIRALCWWKGKRRMSLRSQTDAR